MEAVTVRGVTASAISPISASQRGSGNSVALFHSCINHQLNHQLSSFHSTSPRFSQFLLHSSSSRSVQRKRARVFFPHLVASLDNVEQTYIMVKLDGVQRGLRIRGYSKSCYCGALSRGKDENLVSVTSDEESGGQGPTQVQSYTEGSGPMLVSEFQPSLDVDYIQELLAIQQQGPRYIGFFGTRNMGFMHQELIEILSYALVITKNHIYTSGASGTNAAVIRGALRAEKPELLTVILPQSLKKQPPESQELLAKVQNVIEKPQNDNLSLIEASRLCNMDIISQVQQVICFAFHDSKLLMETCQEAKNLRKIVTLFYLD